MGHSQEGQFDSKLAQYEGDVKAYAAINTRYETFIKIKERFKNQTGQFLDKVLSELAPKFTESIAYDFSD